MSTGSSVQIERIEDILDGRAGYRISAEWGHVSVLEGGGHICALVSKKHPDVNPLWKPPWKTIDPYGYDVSRHLDIYGPLPDGRLLAGLAGHSLSFDHFGPPSQEEIAAGQSTHGEAPALQWSLLDSKEKNKSAFEYGVRLPEAQIDFTRMLTVDSQYPVIYCEESATNLASFDRPISWNEHVTFGPPFLECGISQFDMPATKSRVCPAGDSDHMLLEPDRDFEWPMAPASAGGLHDLRTTPEERYGQYTAQLLDSALEFGFIAASNPKLGTLVVYLFRRADFPWVGNWEERFTRLHKPWSGAAFCRGMEFSSTPFPIPRRETISRGNLFGEETYRWLPAKSKISVRFMTLLLDIPKDFRGVQSVTVKRGQIQVVESELGRKFTVEAESFL